MGTYWFKRRRYGWGWTPVTWQGWVVLAVLVVCAIVPAFVLPDQGGVWVVLYFVWLALVIIAFVVVVTKKGPRPRWRWGSVPTDRPDEDF